MIPWFSKTEGNTYATLLHHPLLFGEIQHSAQEVACITIVPNDKDELIPQIIVTGYRMVIDLRKLNKATKKDHYPLPFIDQMLERLSKHTYFCFLDGYSGFSQIPASKDYIRWLF